MAHETMDRAHLPYRENCPSDAEAQVLAEASVLTRLCLTLMTNGFYRQMPGNTKRPFSHHQNHIQIDLPSNAQRLYCLDFIAFYSIGSNEAFCLLGLFSQALWQLNAPSAAACGQNYLFFFHTYQINYHLGSRLLILVLLLLGLFLGLDIIFNLPNHCLCYLFFFLLLLLLLRLLVLQFLSTLALLLTLLFLSKPFYLRSSLLALLVSLFLTKKLFISQLLYIINLSGINGLRGPELTCASTIFIGNLFTSFPALLLI